MNKKTLLLGGTENPDRYANLAIIKLRSHNHDVIAIGRRNGKVADVEILNSMPLIENIDTVVIYLNVRNQQQYEEYIISLQPKRIIFNPGAENPIFAEKAMARNIEILEACTLVMLSTGQY